MEELFKTVIYHNTKKSNSNYIIVFAVGEIVNIPMVNESHPCLTDSEKETLRHIMETTTNPDLTKLLDTMDGWINANNRIQNMALKKLNEVIRIINESSTGEESISYEYYTYKYRDRLEDCEYKRERNSTNISYIKEDIKYGVIVDVFHSMEKLSFNDIYWEISNYLVNQAPVYIVKKCSKCNEFAVFRLTSSVKASCTVCGSSEDIDNGYPRIDKLFYANQKAKEENDKIFKKSTSNEQVIFNYNGRPYFSHTDDRRKLHEYIYNKRNGKAIFEIKDNKVVFKEDYIEYAKSYDNNFSNIVFELDNIQNNGDYFDEDIALFWYYHHFNIISKVDDCIFVKGETFKTVGDFLKRFVVADKEKQKFYFSLLNDVYLEYFFNKDKEVISPYYKEKDFSKLIYSITKEYVFFDTINKDIHNFGKNFLGDLINDDKLNDLRFRFISEISNELESFGFESLSDYYSSSMDDHYDYNCFFYFMMKNDGYYRFRNLTIPVDNKCIKYIDNIIERKYLNIYHNSQTDKLFSNLYYLYAEDRLNFTAVAQIDTSLKAALNGLKPDFSNLLEIYLRRKQNTSPNSVEFVYHDEIGTLLDHAKNAFKNGVLVDFTKDREIETITNILFKDNKKTIFDNAIKAFTDMNKEIKKIINDTRPAESEE